MIGTLLLMHSLQFMAPPNSCDALKQTLLTDPALAVTWSAPTAVMQSAERPPVHLLTVAGAQIPLPAVPFERMEAMADPSGLSGVRLYSEQHSAEVTLVLQAYDAGLSSEAPGFIDYTITGYGMTPEEIDCDATQDQWQPQMLAMMAKRMQYPIAKNERVYALPDGWLRQGQAADGQAIAATVYPLNEAQSLAIEWRLPAGHPGLWRVLWSLPDQPVPMTATLEQLALCLNNWDLDCLPGSDAISVDVQQIETEQ